MKSANNIRDSLRMSSPPALHSRGADTWVTGGLRRGRDFKYVDGVRLYVEVNPFRGQSGPVPDIRRFTEEVPEFD